MSHQNDLLDISSESRLRRSPDIEYGLERWSPDAAGEFSTVSLGSAHSDREAIQEAARFLAIDTELTRESFVAAKGIRVMHRSGRTVFPLVEALA